MVKKSKNILDQYIERFEKSKKTTEKKLAYLVKRNKKIINTVDIYKDDPASVVLAVADGIYNSLKETNIDALLQSDKKGKKRSVEECRKILDKIVSYRFKFKRTDVEYNQLLRNLLDLDKLCNSFYEKASKIAKLETEEGLIKKVDKLYKPAVRIMERSTEGDEIETAIKNLLNDYYTFPDKEYLVAEIEWAQVNEPELGHGLDDKWQHMVELSAELQSNIQDKEKLKKLVVFDKEYEGFNNIRKEIRERRRVMKKEEKHIGKRFHYEKWRDIV